MVDLRQVNEMKKTTIEIPDPLFLKAKIRAARDGLSMRDLFLRAPFFLIFAILITACAAPTAVPPTATLTPMTPTATLEPSPTATPPAPTEWAVVPTATPELLPADVLATLQGQDYTTVDSDGNGVIDKIVAPNGDTLYQLNSENNWQRMITFTLEGGDKMEMAWFETAEDTYNFMLKNDILWKETWGTRDLENTQEKSDFWLITFHQLAVITEVGRQFGDGLLLSNGLDTLVSRIKVYNLGSNGAITVFLTDEDSLQATYTAQSATEVYFWMDQK